MDMQGIGAALRRRKWSIILPTLLVSAAAIVFVNIVTPKYAVKPGLLLENRVNYLNRPDRAERDPQTNAFDSEGVQSQVQVVMSNDSDARGDQAPEARRQPGNLIRKRRNIDRQRAHGPAWPVEGSDGPLGRRPGDAELYEKLVVYPVGRSRVVGVEFTSKNPVLAAEAANTIAELYLETVSSAKKDLARSASSWLSTNIDDLRKRVQEAERAPRNIAHARPVCCWTGYHPAAAAACRSLHPVDAGAHPAGRCGGEGQANCAK